MPGEKFAALGQGGIMAALDTYAEDVDFLSPVTKTKPDETSSLKPWRGREEAAAFFKELVEECFERWRHWRLLPLSIWWSLRNGIEGL